MFFRTYYPAVPLNFFSHLPCCALEFFFWPYLLCFWIFFFRTYPALPSNFFFFGRTLLCPWIFYSALILLHCALEYFFAPCFGLIFLRTYPAVPLKKFFSHSCPAVPLSRFTLTAYPLHWRHLPAWFHGQATIFLAGHAVILVISSRYELGAPHPNFSEYTSPQIRGHPVLILVHTRRYKLGAPCPNLVGYRRSWHLDFHSDMINLIYDLR